MIRVALLALVVDSTGRPAPLAEIYLPAGAYALEVDVDALAEHETTGLQLCYELGGGPPECFAWSREQRHVEVRRSIRVTEPTIVRWSIASEIECASVSVTGATFAAIPQRPQISLKMLWTAIVEPVYKECTGADGHQPRATTVRGYLVNIQDVLLSFPQGHLATSMERHLLHMLEGYRTYVAGNVAHRAQRTDT